MKRRMYGDLVNGIVYLVFCPVYGVQWLQDRSQAGAGMIVATEAGAIVTDVQGIPLDFSQGARLEANRGVICAAAEIHESLIEQIARMCIASAAGN